ncbi:hypothetical protein [Nocardia sp. NPDC051750]|uniref:hypothetical protein n=1 Tax=Nocardia sp. NPDC051750 TaxID=3364325 RepID=UPI0037B0F857
MSNAPAITTREAGSATATARSAGVTSAASAESLTQQRICAAGRGRAGVTTPAARRAAP